MAQKTSQKSDQPKRLPSKKAITKQGYKPESPKAYAYVKVEQPRFDPVEGDRLSTPSVVTYNQGDWNQFLRHPMGFKIIEILHLPQGWLEPLKTDYFKK